MTKRGIGDNGAPSEFDEVKGEINDLYDEAKNWIDGDPITTQAVADNVDELIKQIKTANKKAEALRVKEKAPLDSQIRVIQDKYAPLIADTKVVTGKTVLALKACKDALQPFKQEQQRLKDEEARKFAEEARLKEREAQEALAAASLDDREAAQELMAESQKLAKSAKRVSKDNVKGMRKTCVVKMCNAKDAAAYFWKNDRDALLEFFQTLAEQKTRQGIRTIPGFIITEEKVIK